ncbi:hypothetical protein BN3087_450018 [Sulfurovum sp. enrichment culture clone C5]|uniref:Uncharacterized protein n=1 Tax=Sulfurovum sp. enrichment culture clone C5 TaxID=497650 RepID=A0A0S4XPA3_9BACT|nr:hypothetical protein BN3087_450018 [Sulfurovum sp. enrichment culture clone C5]
MISPMPIVAMTTPCLIKYINYIQWLVKEAKKHFFSLSVTIDNLLAFNYNTDYYIAQRGVA